MQEDQSTPQSQNNTASALPDVFVIDDLATLKTIADPLRVQIIEQLVAEPMTVKQIAARLGLAPARLYYHINLLEEHSLLQVVEQRLVGNLVEKVYRAAARDIDVAPSLLSFDTEEGKASLTSIIVSTLDVTREDMLRSLDARTYALAHDAPEQPRRMRITRQIYHLPDSEVDALQDQVDALMAALEAATVPKATGDDRPHDQRAADSEGIHTYALTLAFYPHFDYLNDPNADPATENNPTDG